MPEKHGQPLIFMIGCGHIEGGQWRFSYFTADALTETEEAGIIDDWLAHINAVRERLAPELTTARLIHWSHAEPSFLVGSYNSAKARHDRPNWPALPWFDFLSEVMRKEPVVVHGALTFGLKAVAKALHGHGFIDTLWQDSPSDGLGAMVGAWRCQEDAATSGQPLTTMPLMQEISAYNEVDCKVMQEIVAYLRARH